MRQGGRPRGRTSRSTSWDHVLAWGTNKITAPPATRVTRPATRIRPLMRWKAYHYQQSSVALIRVHESPACLLAVLHCEEPRRGAFVAHGRAADGSASGLSFVGATVV